MTLINLDTQNFEIENILPLIKRGNFWNFKDKIFFQLNELDVFYLENKRYKTKSLICSSESLMNVYYKLNEHFNNNIKKISKDNDDIFVKIHDGTKSDKKLDPQKHYKVKIIMSLTLTERENWSVHMTLKAERIKILDCIQQTNAVPDFDET